jgi:alanine racemase
VSVGARALIRLEAIRHNLRRIKDFAGGAKVMAVVKANAYGHGSLPVARALDEADALAVARIQEGIALRAAGIGQPLVVFHGAANREDLRAATEYRMQPVVHCEAQVELLEAAPRGDAVVWLKVDTGMRRLGVEMSEVRGLLSRLSAAPAVREVRLMTHLSHADEREAVETARQLGRFARLLDGFNGQFSIANSAGLLGWPETIHAGQDAARSWVRSGIALYGVSPFPASEGSEFGLRAAMEFEARLVSVKPIRAGEAVGYGGDWRAPHDTLLGIVSVGYGDGYSRYLPSGTPMLVEGRTATLAGRVSMDAAAVDLGPDSAASLGDRVVLWGKDLPVETIAARAGTIPYTLLAGVTHREAPEIIEASIE